MWYAKQTNDVVQRFDSTPNNIDLLQDQTRARTTTEVVGSCACRRPEVVELARVLMTLTRRSAIAFHCSDVAGSSRTLPLS